MASARQSSSSMPRPAQPNASTTHSLHPYPHPHPHLHLHLHPRPRPGRYPRPHLPQTPIRAVSSVVMPMCFGACSAFVDSSKGINPKHTKAYDADPGEALKVRPPRSCFDQIVLGRPASISNSLRLERSDTLLDYDTSFHLAPPRFTMHRLLTLRSNPYTSFRTLSDTVWHAV